MGSGHHFLNLLFFTLLARSGIEVLSALPKLYLSDHCPPGRDVVRFSKKVFCAGSREPPTAIRTSAPVPPSVSRTSTRWVASSTSVQRLGCDKDLTLPAPAGGDRDDPHATGRLLEAA